MDLFDEQAQMVYLAMPISHAISMILMFNQMFHYFKVLDWMNKYVALLWRGATDCLGFMILYVIFQLFWLVFYHTLGGVFGMDSDVGNYHPDTKTDYAYMPYWGIQALVAIEASFGGIQMSDYSYWIDRYENDNKLVSQLYIFFLWFAYIGQGCFYGLFLLNYLVAIVGDTYGAIMESQQLQVVLGRDQLNCENQRQQMIEAERDLELIVMCTVGGGSGGGGEWQGATSAIKKRIGETDTLITKRAK